MRLLEEFATVVAVLVGSVAGLCVLVVLLVIALTLAIGVWRKILDRFRLGMFVDTTARKRLIEIAGILEDAGIIEAWSKDPNRDYVFNVKAGRKIRRVKQ